MSVYAGAIKTPGKENTGNVTIANPASLVVPVIKRATANRPQEVKYVLPYVEYWNFINEVLVFAYAFLDPLFPDLAASSLALSKVDAVQETLQSSANNNIQQEAVVGPVYINTGRTNGTVEQKFQTLKSSYTGILLGNNTVRMDTFVLLFYKFYSRTVEAVLAHWERLSKAGKDPKQKKAVELASKKCKRTAIAAAMEPLQAQEVRWIFQCVAWQSCLQPALWLAQQSMLWIVQVRVGYQ
jgi:hypothetical protein